MSESFDIRKEEYTALRREIGNDLEEISDLERNCVLAAAVAYSWLISCVAKETGVAARPIHAIMYMEATHGYYDAPLSLFCQNKSLLPMNVNVDYWVNAFGDRKSMSGPYNNIKAGAKF